MPGSALLVGGDPGIGKSTIILQALGKYAQNGGHAIYISGEEAMAQVRMRAARMGLADAPLMLGAATNVEDILATLEAGKPPGIVAIDSIQTLWTGALDAAPGTIAQVRTASFDLVRYAKASGAALLLVGHVTKDGQIAGPKAVEHLVDAVLYFEGERGHHFRVLRAVKNRFGATDEIGVFEMTGKGLAEVANPSALFLGDRKSAAPGTAVFAGLEGTRPLLCEIQALVSPTAYGTPRRAVVGWDTGRLAMILAVLDARAGVGIGAADVYLNVAGGLKIGEPAADLAAAAALVSSFGGEPLPRDCVFFGEISLSGDIRPVPQAEARLKEAAKLGFKTAFVPAGTKADVAGPGVNGDYQRRRPAADLRLSRSPAVLNWNHESVRHLPRLPDRADRRGVGGLCRLARLSVGNPDHLRLGGGGVRLSVFRALCDSPDPQHGGAGLAGFAAGLCRGVPGGVHSLCLHEPPFQRNA